MKNKKLTERINEIKKFKIHIKPKQSLLNEFKKYKWVSSSDTQIND